MENYKEGKYTWLLAIPLTAIAFTLLAFVYSTAI